MRCSTSACRHTGLGGSAPRGYRWHIHASATCRTRPSPEALFHTLRSPCNPANWQFALAVNAPLSSPDGSAAPTLKLVCSHAWRQSSIGPLPCRAPAGRPPASWLEFFSGRRGGPIEARHSHRSPRSARVGYPDADTLTSSPPETLEWDLLLWTRDRRRHPHF